jgi:hypothetical protein
VQLAAARLTHSNYLSSADCSTRIWPHSLIFRINSCDILMKELSMLCPTNSLTDASMPFKGAPRRSFFSIQASAITLRIHRDIQLTRRYGCQIALFAIAVAVSVQISTHARADVVTLQSGVSPADTYRTQDAHVRNDNLPKTDNNTRIVFGSLVGTPGAGKSLRGLYSYPLTGFDGGIPAGATINSVEFHVMQVDSDAPASTAGPISIELRSISESFLQGTGVLDPPDGASWNNTFGATMTLGSTILTSATMDAKPATVPVTGAPETWIETTFATSPDLVAAVQAQLNASQPFNFSLVLPTSFETSGERRIFRTPSNTEVNTGLVNRPRLIIDYTVSTPGVPGDYSGDGTVDAADYTVWRDNLDGDAAALAVGSRDPGNSGVVNNTDYEFWKSKFGGGSGGASSLSGAAVPEPSTIALTLLVIAVLRMKRRRA